MQHISSRPIKNTGGVVLTKRTATISNEFTDAPIVIKKTDISRPLSTVSTIERTQLKRESSSGGSSQENHNTLDSKSSKNSEKVPKILQNRNFVASPFADPFPMRTPEVTHPSSAVVTTTTSAAQKSKIVETTPKRVVPPASGSAHSSDSGSFDDTNMDNNNHNRNAIEDDDANTYGDFGQLKGPAKALYDYIPIEGDEIELKKGELLEVISGPDHLGWCMGRKNNETGLFPASYVAPV
uniref:SH3 domain-containing protein n=1 Tax=Panagrolaimus sp. PS1159 TaxID=55785 RepID=A0AC35FQ33_9BILA